ncbi:MAG: hypothetical protein QXW79_00640 [Thermoplasmata archaeon]
MDLLDHPLVSDHISAYHLFDLRKNNTKLGVIFPLANDFVDKSSDYSYLANELTSIYDKIVSNSEIENSYYYLNNLFTLAQTIGPKFVMKLIVNAFSNKIRIILDSILDENGKLMKINLAIYMQIWNEYKNFSARLYHLIKNYQDFLVEKKIVVDEVSYNIFLILQVSLFYNNIINRPESNVLSIVSDEIGIIDKNNIEQLIDYIYSIRTFISINNLFYDNDQLTPIVTSIMKRASIINALCSYMHKLLKTLEKSGNVRHKKSKDFVGAEKKTIKKILKITTILGSYANKDILLLCYAKFMQARITDLQYDYLDLELELIEEISLNLGDDDSKRLRDTVDDIIRSKNNNTVIHSISTNILNPIILDKTAWQIYNTMEIELKYPAEMRCHLDIISKYYQDTYSNKYIINWYPTMGMACFEASLGSKNINITCNILQAIALLYLNDHPDATIQHFSAETLINMKLARKIFESLFEANLIIIKDNNREIYTVNIVNYTGDANLDIRPIFVDVFADGREC